MEDKRNLNVLYVDDDEDSRELVRFTLELAEMDVTLATTADEAWKSAQMDGFDLFLLDGVLADGMSMDLCSELRGFAPNTPILFYSAQAFRPDIEKAFAAGACGYLVKPFSGDLAASIIGAIRDSKAGIVRRQTSSDRSYGVAMREMPKGYIGSLPKAGEVEISTLSVP